MANGDTLQIVAGHQAFATPGGVRVLGPYPIAWNTAQVLSPATLGALVATVGSHVTGWALITMDFNQPGLLQITASLNANEPRTSAAQLGGFECVSPEVTPAVAKVYGTDVGTLQTNLPRQHYAAGIQYICVAVYPDATSPTAGSADIYLLVQTT